jgi:hypothetical protein
MPQPPTLPVIPYELVTIRPSLSQRTFQSAAAGAASTFIWEWDLALRLTDTGQFVSALAAPANSTCTVLGGAGPQTTPQPAFGPFLDAVAFTSGAGGGTITVEYAVDASPCNYRTMAITIVPANTLTNLSGLRVTGRFVRITFTNVTAAATIEFGSYIRNL